MGVRYSCPRFRVCESSIWHGPSLPDCEQEIVGIRHGEKLHEVLLTREDARQAIEFDDYFVIKPPPFISKWPEDHLKEGKCVADDFQYSSDGNSRWLSEGELLAMISEEDSSH